MGKYELRRLGAVGAGGRFEGTIAYEEASDTALAKIKRLVEG